MAATAPPDIGLFGNLGVVDSTASIGSLEAARCSSFGMLLLPVVVSAGEAAIAVVLAAVIWFVVPSEDPACAVWSATGAPSGAELVWDIVTEGGTSSGELLLPKFLSLDTPK